MKRRSFSFATLLLAMLALGCRAEAPLQPSTDDERLFADARSCDSGTEDCARLRAEATGRATRSSADHASRRAKTFTFSPPQ